MKNLYSGIKDANLVKVIKELDLLLMTNCRNYRSTNDSIYIASYEDMKSEIAKLEGEGFGYMCGNYRLNKQCLRVVILSEEHCIKLSDDEQKAVILHELGHLLNHPLKQMNIMEKIQNIRNGSTVKIDTPVKRELYADFYAKRHGYGEALLESFKNFNDFFNKEVGHCEVRIRAIYSTAEYNGFVRPI